jgi:anti-sigma factor RsiW
MNQPHDRLSAWIDGELNAAERDQMREHLSSSHELQRDESSLRAVSHAVRAAVHPRLLPIQLERFHAVVAAIRERAMLQTSIASAFVAAAVLLVSIAGLDQFHQGGASTINGDDWTVVLTGNIDAAVGDTIEADPTESLLRELAEAPNDTP